MFFTDNKQKGFTLIELLVVIAIIGSLSSVVLASLNSARAKGRDAKLAAEIRNMMIAAELYYDDNGFYPMDGSGGSWLYTPLRGSTSRAGMKAAFAPYIKIPESSIFNNPNKPLNPEWRASYRRVSNSAFVNLTHGTNCTANVDCYFIAVWPETTGPLGTADTVTYFLNGNKITQAYTIQMH